jgi:hypothetical protein
MDKLMMREIGPAHRFRSDHIFSAKTFKIYGDRYCKSILLAGGNLGRLRIGRSGLASNFRDDRSKLTLSSNTRYRMPAIFTS